MESMGKKRPRPRRSFTPEFKAEIVELCQRGDRSIGRMRHEATIPDRFLVKGLRERSNDVVSLR